MDQELEQEVMEVVDDTPAEEIVEETPVEDAPAEEPEGEEPAEEPASGDDDEAGEEAAEGEAEDEEPIPDNIKKFKASVYNKDTKQLEQKEYEIDKRFDALLKDPESAKAVRELHEKAYGLDSIKDRYAETRTFAGQVAAENQEIKSSIQDLRTTYNSAIKSGNYHKLDGFFEKLQIPQDVVLNYALAKVQLNEMDPAQKQMVLNQLETEKRAETLAQQQSVTEQSFAQQAQQLRQIQLDTTLASPNVDPLVKAFDERMGKTGAFREACVQAGQLAYFQRKADLSPAETVKAVIDMYNLTVNPMVPAAKQVVPAAGASAGAQKPVVKRTPGMIPNVQGRSASPLKSKPKSVEDLKKYRKEQYGF